ncbi:DUF3987 domain-containing protein [Streptosporangium sp. CA-135522]|uniref:DUF3987 domain-containing protein n=1 Tax=Streptosporangium sp. CA-135522 TaxID=3240072 RepID=UPI003D92C9B0
MSSNAPVISNAAFSGLFGRITNALDTYTEGSKVGVLVSLMSGFSAYAGHGPTVETGKGDSPLALWTVLVGPSGRGRKGTATSLAMRVLSQAFNTFHDDAVIYGLPATGLGYITELSDRAEGGTATPVQFIEEEGDSFIANARRDTKVGVYLRKSWDAQTIAHKTKQDDLRVRRPHVGVIMHCQPRNWAAISGTKDATGGTYNRFLPVWVQQSKTLPVFEASNASEVIRAAARELRNAADYARQVDSVIVPRHVAETFEAKHRPIIEAMISSEEMSQYAERAMAYMIRLAALYALSERRDEVSEADFDAALALVSYSIETIAYILPQADTSEEASMTIKVEAFIREAENTGRTATEIYRAFNIKASDLHGIVAELDTITVVKGESVKGRGGRPSVRYIYTGEPAETFEDEDIAEGDIVEDTDDGCEETNVAEETPTLLAPLTVAANEETNPKTLEDQVFSPVTVCPLILSEDEWEAFDAETVTASPASAKATPVTVNPDLPRGVEALRAMLDGTATTPKPVEIPATVEPAPAMPVGVDALRALLSQATPTTATVAKTTPPAAAVSAVPLVLFQAPTSEGVAA